MVTDDPAKPGPRYASGTVAAIPNLVVDHAGINLTVDARKGRAVKAVVDAPDPATVVGDMTLQYTVRTAGGPVATSSSLVGAADNHLYAVPVRGDAKTFAFGYNTVLTATGHGPDRTYYAAIPVVGRIPANPVFRLRDRDLHRSEARYFSHGVPAATADRVAFPHYLPGQTFSSTQTVHVPLPSRRVELHTTAGVWSEMILQQYLPNGPVGLFEGAVERPDVTLKAGRDRTEWNKPVSGPDLSTPDFVNMVYRSGNTLRANVSSYSPSEPGHVGDPVDDLFFVKGSAVLSRDGKVVGTKTNPTVSSFTLPADAGRYTLALTANRARPWSALATQVSTAWTFTSAPPATESELLALPTVKIGGDFGGTGTAPAGRRFTLDIVATSQAGAPPAAVTALSVEVSGDDGKTWQAVPCGWQRAGHWRVPVTNPAAAGGYVSLRVKATNALGNTLEQTVIRAYGLSQGMP
jgi:hypothetical protein